VKRSLQCWGGLEYVDEGDRVVLEGDIAVAVCVGDQVIFLSHRRISRSIQLAPLTYSWPNLGLMTKPNATAPETRMNRVGDFPSILQKDHFVESKA